MEKDGSVRKALIHVRITAPPELLEVVTDRLVACLEEDYEIIEVAGPRPIHGDEMNQKSYISVR